MRIRTPYASVWVDELSTTNPLASPAIRPAIVPAVSARKAAQVRWATRAYVGRHGRYVAVRLSGSTLAVAIAEPGGALRWVPAATALSTAEALAWLHAGFSQ